MGLIELAELIEEHFYSILQDEMKRVTSLKDKKEIAFCEGQMIMLEDVLLFMHNIQDENI